MSIRGLGDAYAFRRLLWLVIATVIVPTALLALYGVFAIRNHRAAIAQRAQAEREAQLHGLAAEVVHEIDRLDGVVRATVVLCGEAGDCPFDVAGVDAVWAWSAVGDPPEPLDTLGIPAELSRDTVWVVPSDGTEPVGLFRSGDLLVGWRIDRSHLQAMVERVGRERHGQEGVFGLEVARPAPMLSFDDMMRRWQQPYAAAISLAPPLAHWRVTVAADDEFSRTMARTSWLYMLGLIALVVTVMAGTGITLGSTMREIRLSRLQTDFVSSISHELRTPLTSIRMFVETLQSGRLKDPERIDECLALLGEESDRLSRRIERVLNWARMEAGRRVYDVEPVAAGQIIDEVLQAYRTHTLLDEDNHEFEVVIPDDLPQLAVDRDAIVEALLNLVQNAVRYTDPPRRIRVFAERNGSQVGVGVEDNGPGIARRDRRRIWEKFYRADDLLTRPVDGSGLGLAIVRAVVQGHGGKVHLDTEVGRGSRFTMWLPAA